MMLMKPKYFLWLDLDQNEILVLTPLRTKQEISSLHLFVHKHIYLSL